MANIEVGLAYRDDTVSKWTEMARSSEQRRLNCNFTTAKVRRRIQSISGLGLSLFFSCLLFCSKLLFKV